MNNQEYDQKAQSIRQLAALPPDGMANHLTNVHPEISNIAPNIAPHIFSAASSAVQFLNSKLPSAGNELPQDHYVSPSRTQQAAWLDLHKTVSDPTSVLEKIKNQTLNQHHVEAIKTVYPDLHEEIKGKIVEQLGKQKSEGKKMPYGQRIAMAKYVGMPLDSTMTSQSMQAIMKSASGNAGPEAQASQQQQQAPKGSKPSGTELTQINKVNAIYQTPGQAREVSRRA